MFFYSKTKIMLPVLLFLTLQPSTCFSSESKKILLYSLQPWCLFWKETSNVKTMSLLWNVNIHLQSELLLLIFISTRTWWRPVANRTKDLSRTQSSSGLLLCIFSWKVYPRKTNKKNKKNEFSRLQRSSGLLCWNLTSIKQ